MNSTSKSTSAASTSTGLHFSSRAVTPASHVLKFAYGTGMHRKICWEVIATQIVVNHGGQITPNAVMAVNHVQVRVLLMFRHNVCSRTAVPCHKESMQSSMPATPCTRSLAGLGEVMHSISRVIIHAQRNVEIRCRLLAHRLQSPDLAHVSCMP